MNGKRNANFSPKEKEELVNLIYRHLHIIENKTTNTATNQFKNETWKKICAEYNSKLACKRPVDSLKTQWDNLKKKTRQYNAQRRQETYATGGGVITTDINTLFERISGMIPDSFIKGLENRYDSDFMADKSLDEDSVNDTEEDLDPNFEIYSYLQEKKFIPDWTKISKKNLKSPISTPLLNKIKGISASDTPMTSRDSVETDCYESLDCDHVINIDQSDEEDNEAILEELRKEENVIDKIESKSKKRMSKISETKLKNDSEKHDLEIEILKKKLQKEKLCILEKELQIKILQHELRKVSIQSTYPFKRPRSAI